MGMLRHIYSLDPYDSNVRSPSVDDTLKLFIVEEKYDVKDLLSRTVKDVERKLQTDRNKDSFPHCVREIYDLPVHCEDLHKVTSSACRKSLRQLMTKKEFRILEVW